MCADFLENNYDRVSSECLSVIVMKEKEAFPTLELRTNCPSVHQVFKDYEKLLHSENYVTKRQSLKVKHHSRAPVGFCGSLTKPHK